MLKSTKVDHCDSLIWQYTCIWSWIVVTYLYFLFCCIYIYIYCKHFIICCFPWLSQALIVMFLLSFMILSIIVVHAPPKGVFKKACNVATQKFLSHNLISFSLNIRYSKTQSHVKVRTTRWPCERMHVCLVCFVPIFYKSNKMCVVGMFFCSVKKHLCYSIQWKFVQISLLRLILSTNC